MSGFANITNEIGTKLVEHTFEVALVIFTALSNESDVMINKGTGKTQSDETPRKEEEDALASLSAVQLSPQR